MWHNVMNLQISEGLIFAGRLCKMSQNSIYHGCTNHPPELRIVLDNTANLSPQGLPSRWKFDQNRKMLCTSPHRDKSHPIPLYYVVVILLPTVDGFFPQEKHQRGQSYSWYIVHVIIQLDSWIYGGEIIVDFRSRIGLLCLIVSHLIDRTILALACSHKTYKHCSPIGLECITVSRKTSLPHTPEKSIFLISKTFSNILEGFCIVNTEKF